VIIMRIAKLLLLAVIIFGIQASAQVSSSCPGWDNSGNAMLDGPYNIRHILWVPSDDGFGDVIPFSITGQITFDGNGNYTFAGTLIDGFALTTVPYTSVTGTYVTSSSGYTCMDNLVNEYWVTVYGAANETVIGLVTNGIFIGSSTENFSGFAEQDLVIAAPNSPAATNATFTGSYSMMDFDAPDGSGEEGASFASMRDMLFTMSANGNGTLSGTIAGTGYIGENGGSVTSQSFSNLKYSFSNGSGSIAFSGTLSQSNEFGTLIAGPHTLFISPDGNLIFGGAPNGWDLFVGVRTTAGAPTKFSGLYYQAGMDSFLTNGAVDGYYGSFQAGGQAVGQPGTGNIIGHQRLNLSSNSAALDFTYVDSYTFNANGSTDDANTAQHYVYGLNGALRIGIGDLPVGGAVGLNVTLAAPALTGPGVFLNANGILNAASFAPSTAGLAPGELITLSGTNLALTSSISPFLPSMNLDGVQVLIQGFPAPLYYISPGEIEALVPFEISGAIVTVQVINNNNGSNVVTMFTSATQPGSFTQTENGIGYVDAEHMADFTEVTTSSPAEGGETILVFTTGFGLTSPTVADGTQSPAGAPALNLLNAFIGGTQATVSFEGLAPGYVGLYEMTLVVPTGLTPGDNILEIAGPDSDNFEAKISIGTVGAAAVQADARSQPTAQLARPHARPAVKKARPSAFPPRTHPGAVGVPIVN
jgi:uncharacterized protein (TIGR03437 family)